MATKTLVKYIDDIDGEEADETVSFELDGVAYEIDLREQNADTLREAFALYIERGRRTGGRHQSAAQRGTGKAAKGSGLRPVTRPGASPATGEFTKEERTSMREWGRANGFTISVRGRIPEELQRRWLEAGRPS